MRRDYIVKSIKDFKHFETDINKRNNTPRFSAHLPCRFFSYFTGDAQWSMLFESMALMSSGRSAASKHTEAVPGGMAA